jgi:hypothetical protein
MRVEVFRVTKNMTKRLFRYDFRVIRTDHTGVPTRPVIVGYHPMNDPHQTRK